MLQPAVSSLFVKIKSTSQHGHAPAGKSSRRIYFSAQPDTRNDIRRNAPRTGSFDIAFLGMHLYRVYDSQYILLSELLITVIKQKATGKNTTGDAL
jgi:hypothetical protein